MGRKTDKKKNASQERRVKNYHQNDRTNSWVIVEKSQGFVIENVWSIALDRSEGDFCALLNTITETFPGIFHWARTLS